MRHSAAVAIAVALLAPAAHADEGRFDAQVFRPSAAPRDLVMVAKSEVIGHMSPTVGIYYDFGFDPLVLLSNDTGQTLEAVGARMTLTGLAGIGFFDLFDLQLAVPFIAWQTSDNLRTLGTEGKVQPQSLGDIRLSSKWSLPFFNRKQTVTSGLGMAVVGNINLPTGSEKAFTSDGVMTGGLSLITDYRLDFGAIITANAGVWLRPDTQFTGVRIGNMGSFGLAAETYLVQSWGLSVLGGVYGYPSLTKFPDSARQVPAEALLALRWQTKSGVTLTIGGSFGAACSFGAPALRIFSGISITPKTSREQEHINRILESESLDPDQDGMNSDVDRCPDVPGPPQNIGCPDSDRDGDGLVDRQDQCPDMPGGPDTKGGCPVAYIEGDQIVILEKVHFATDRDIILDESKSVLEAVAQVLRDHPEILLVRIEGHTDVRASDIYNMNLSQRRVNSVLQFLAASGIDSSRMEARGYGHSRPLYDDSHCDRRDEQLDEECLFLTSQNRRVVFRIINWSPDKK